MRKFILILFIVVGFSSCAWFKTQVDYMKLCQNDPVCLSEAKRDSALVSTVVGTAYPVAGPVSGAIVLAIVLWFRGRKLVKKDEVK